MQERRGEKDLIILANRRKRWSYLSSVVSRQRSRRSKPVWPGSLCLFQLWWAEWNGAASKCAPPHFPRIPTIPRPPAQPWPWAQQGQNPHPDPSIMRQLFLIKTPTHPPNSQNLLLYHPQSSVPPSPPTMQSGPALLHLTSLAGAEQRPTRHWDNETGVWCGCVTACVCRWGRKCKRVRVYICYCTAPRRCIS